LLSIVSAFDCPTCDHPNPFGAKFCNECGAPLRWGGGAGPAPEATVGAQFAVQWSPTAWKPGDFPMPALASLVSSRLEESSRRWRRYLVTAAVALGALALPTGWYLYYPSGQPPGGITAAPSALTDAPSAPIALLAQSIGELAASRLDAVAGEPPPAVVAAPDAAPEARCPAAIEAIALCDWLVRAKP
jgi:hypothetical protein